MGWRFTAVQPNLSPRVFWGLRRAAVQLGSGDEADREGRRAGLGGMERGLRVLDEFEGMSDGGSGSGSDFDLGEDEEEGEEDYESSEGPSGSESGVEGEG